MRLGRLWAGFWKPQNSILEPPGLDFGASSLDFEASNLDCGASRPPTFLCLCFPHSATPLGKRGTVSCLGFIPFVFLPSSTALPKCGRRRCPPLGAFNGIDVKNVLFYNIDFFGFWPQVGRSWRPKMEASWLQIPSSSLLGCPL